jgi:glycerol-3-phosphate dehydrogenase (NAD(P)+)
LFEKTVVVGTTTWGTTLALVLAGEGRPVTLLARDQHEGSRLESARENARFLPGAAFPALLRVSAKAAEALDGAALAVIAVPSHRMRENARRIAPHLGADTVVVSASKGLELPSALRMSEALAEELPTSLHPGICALSGPNLAKEIAQGKLASTVIAGATREATERAQALLLSGRFRVYTSSDVTGVELGGALKNIVALGAGICDGLEFGENAKAAFITRGLAEIARLGVAAGAHPLTFAGLAGVGDVIATCASRLSRNRYVGEQLALGRSWPEIRASMDNVAEGVNATEGALMMAARLNVEMPIAQTAYRILHEGLPLREAASELMERPVGSEW